MTFTLGLSLVLIAILTVLVIFTIEMWHQRDLARINANHWRKTSKLYEREYKELTILLEKSMRRELAARAFPRTFGNLPRGQA